MTLAPTAFTYTVWASWGDQGGEEVDVVASSRAEARSKAEAVLTRDYEPGWKITRIEQRLNGYLFF